MDSRLIYATSKALTHKIIWNKKTIDSEWIFIGDQNQVKNNIVEENINKHFQENNFYVSFTRTNSFEAEKQNIIEKILGLLRFENFVIWDIQFKRL